MTRHAGDSEKNTSGVKTAVTKECQEEGEECTKPDGGRGEPLVGKEVGREEGAQRGTCPQRQPLQTSALLWPRWVRTQLAQLPEVSG